MPKPKTLGVLVERTGDDPPTFSAGVVWGAMPFLTGLEEGATPEAAVAALAGSVRRLGYEPTVVVFDTLEAAQAEGRRRVAAEDLLRSPLFARAKLRELLAGEDREPDGRDHRVLDELDGVLRAVRAVANSAYDRQKQEARPPIRDGRIFCPACGPDYPDTYFTATADGLATAYLSPTGKLQTWDDVYISDESYREIRCGACGANLGDLTLEDLRALAKHRREEE